MGSYEVTKYLTFLLLNILIAACGAILLAFGAILQVDENKGIKNFASLSIGGFSIGMGVLVFIMACYGCCALFKKKPGMLTSYAVVMIILFVIQIVLGGIALGSSHNSKCEQDEELTKAVGELFSKQDESSMKTINSVQRTFRCCGVHGPHWWRPYNKTYPASCCSEQKEPCAQPFQAGCAAIYAKVIQKNVVVIGGVAIGFAVVEIIAAILAWYIRLTIEKVEYM